MKQFARIGLGVVALSIVSFVAYMVYTMFRQQKQSKGLSEKPVLPDIPLPPIAAPKSNVVLPQNAQEVRDRERQIFSNAAERARVISEYNVPIYNVATSKYSEGIRETLQGAGINSIPIVPLIVSREYGEQIDAFLSARDFYKIAEGVGGCRDVKNCKGRVEASKVYLRLMNFSSVGISLFPSLEKSVDTNAFGVYPTNGDAKRGRYWDFDNAIKAFKDYFSVVKEGNRQLGEALKIEAIKQLRSSGYKIEGYGTTG